MTGDEIDITDEGIKFPKSQNAYWILIFLLLATLFIGPVGCNDINNKDTALKQLFQKEKALNCQLASMKDSIKTEWDKINHLLEETLPADMPLEEKRNMLKVRNANLIRMFQSFDNVDKKVKMALNETEQMDIEMTKRITVLKKEIQKIESEKMSFFQKINRKSGADELARIKRIYKTSLSEDCK